LLLAGLAAVGGTVGVQSTLLLGCDMRRDFLYSFTSLVVLLVPFLLITCALIGFNSARARFLALLFGGLIAAGHTLYDTERQLLGKISSPRWCGRSAPPPAPTWRPWPHSPPVLVQNWALASSSMMRCAEIDSPP